MSRLDSSPKPSLGGFQRVERRAVSLDQPVRVRPTIPGRQIPMTVEPAIDGLDLVEWATTHRGELERLLTEHRALLFRGFHVESVDQFERFVAASSTGEPLKYRDRSTPRNEVGTGIYVSTIYPSDQRIRPHNEGTYWMRWALKIYFCCLQAAEQGGETPIADVRRVLGRIDPDVRRSFAEKGVMYVRNYNDGLGLPWQDVFQTSDRDEVEAYCRDNRISFEWKDGERLRTRQVRPAIRLHPKTGEPVWFNHAAFFHITSQEPDVRDALLRDLAMEDLPYNTYYGDGAPIPPEVVEHLRAAYREETILFPWQNGDVMLLDNMTVAHAREPYKGERRIVVAMTEPVSEDGASS